VIATVEEEIRQQNRDAIQAYEMPRPCPGQTVTWFPSGSRDGKGENAQVLSAGKRNIVVLRASGGAMESVRHVEDPKLKLSAEQRASGAWDFTERDKKLDTMQKEVGGYAAMFTALELRVATLEELLNEPAKKGKQ
jgi:hypothetical protein